MKRLLIFILLLSLISCEQVEEPTVEDDSIRVANNDDSGIDVVETTGKPYATLPWVYKTFEIDKASDHYILEIQSVLKGTLKISEIKATDKNGEEIDLSAKNIELSPYL